MALIEWCFLQLLNLVTDIGGGVGLYTGISALTLAEIVPFVFELTVAIMALWKSRKVDSSIEAGQT